MKKILKKSTAVILCLTLFLSLFAVSSTAYTEEEWKTYFNEYRQTQGNILMSPGSDESERNFSWYSEKGNGVMKISEKEDMSDTKSFRAKSAITPEGNIINKVTVTGLEKGKKYYYRAETKDAQSKIFSFTTLEDDNFTAMYVTDIHVTYEEDEMEDSLLTESYNVDKLLESATSNADLDLVVSAGDQASYGLKSEYLSVIASPKWSSIPFSLCAGNHDRKGYDYKVFNNNPNQYKLGTSSYIANDYWYVKGNALFMVFDSNCYAASTHRAFAKAACKANPDVRWKVAVYHHDTYGIMSEKRLAVSEEYLRPIFGSICDEFGVDIALTGHTHYYTISNVVYDSKTVTDVDANSTINDAAGTIYLVSGSINHARTYDLDDGDIADENVGYTTRTTGILYNIIDFSGDKLTVSGYEVGADEPFNTLTITKSSNDGGHSEYEPGSDDGWERFKFEIEAFFTEIGIAFKVIFKWSEIMEKQGLL